MCSKKSHYNKYLKGYSRDLRNDSTLGEIILWKRVLRAKQVFKYQFNRQFPMKVGKLNIIVDFICRKLKLVIEVDGGSHRFKQEQDAYRDRTLGELGYHVLRISEQEARHKIDYVVAVIDDKIKEIEGLNE
jgi:very-short-patch-repair endonuclease